MRTLAVALLALAASSCVTTKEGDVEELKPSIKAFYERVRWRDFRGAADLLIEEKRDAFVRGREAAKDDRDLFITGYELEDAKVAPDKLTAKVYSKLSWYRLPSTTEETKTVASVFVWRSATWQLESQDEGPFPELKP